jgi:hypothetical protein
MRACGGTPRDRFEVRRTARYPCMVTHLVKVETPCGSLTCKKVGNEEYACLGDISLQGAFPSEGRDEPVVLARWLVQARERKYPSTPCP